MWDSRAPDVGQPAADLTLLDEMERPVALSALAGPVLILIFRSPADEAGLRMLRDYRDFTLDLRKLGVALCAVAQAEPSTLAYLRSERGLGFPLLADRDGSALESWGMRDSNGLFLLDRRLRVLQRSPGERASAGALLAFVRRGGARERLSIFERILHPLRTVQAALRPRRLAG